MHYLFVYSLLSLFTYISLQDSTLFAVVRVRNANTTTYDTTSLERTVVTLVTDTNEGAGPYVRVANNAFAVAFLA